jgi:acyl-CoA thioesterase
MSDALFLRDGDHYIPTELSGGPWNPQHLHGGPPAGLLAQVLEAATDPAAMRLARFTIDLLRPVPRAPLRVSVDTVRAGRRLQLLSGSIFADGVEVCRASALYLERQELEVPDYGQFKGAPMPARDESAISTLAELSGFSPKHGGLIGLHTTAEACLVDGTGGRGQGRVWMRLPVPVVAGEPASSTVQVATLADFGNGVGQLRLDDSTGSINTDITLYLHRIPTSPWLGLDSRSRMESNGAGLTETTLYDDEGPIGRVVQATLVMPWRRKA